MHSFPTHTQLSQARWNLLPQGACGAEMLPVGTRGPWWKGGDPEARKGPHACLAHPEPAPHSCFPSQQVRSARLPQETHPGRGDASARKPTLGANQWLQLDITCFLFAFPSSETMGNSWALPCPPGSLAQAGGQACGALLSQTPFLPAAPSPKAVLCSPRCWVPSRILLLSQA